MRTFFSISAAAALITMALTSCSGDRATQGQEKELVYEGSMAEPQMGEQPVAHAAADTLKGSTEVTEIISK